MNERDDGYTSLTIKGVKFVKEGETSPMSFVPFLDGLEPSDLSPIEVEPAGFWGITGILMYIKNFTTQAYSTLYVPYAQNREIKLSLVNGDYGMIALAYSSDNFADAQNRMFCFDAGEFTLSGTPHSLPVNLTSNCLSTSMFAFSRWPDPSPAIFTGSTLRKIRIHTCSSVGGVSGESTTCPCTVSSTVCDTSRVYGYKVRMPSFSPLKPEFGGAIESQCIVTSHTGGFGQTTSAVQIPIGELISTEVLGYGDASCNGVIPMDAAGTAAPPMHVKFYFGTAQPADGPYNPISKWSFPSGNSEGHLFIQRKFTAQ